MTDLSNVTAVILAGGLGTRLRRVVSDRPKVMAEINGKPFITYLLDQLIKMGFGRVIICTGYMANVVEDFIGAKYRNLYVDYSREETPLGTAGAIKLAGKIIDTEYCMVMNGDSFIDFDVKELIKIRKDYISSILLCNHSNVSNYGTIKIDKHNNKNYLINKGSIQYINY